MTPHRCPVDAARNAGAGAHSREPAGRPCLARGRAARRGAGCRSLGAGSAALTTWPATLAAWLGASLRGMLLAGLAGLGAGAVQAGPLADPTRPPPSFSGSGSAAADGSAGGAGPRPAPDEPAPLLQGLQRPAKGTAMAMIDGRLVKAGDMVGTRRVTAIDGSGVLLDGEPGPLRLSLIEGSPKQPAGSPLPARSARYTPAPADGEAPPARTGPGMSPPSPATAGALSVAGRTSP